MTTGEPDPVPARPSLESLVEAGMLEVESLHPGGLDLTRELAGLCGIGNETSVLDVATGTGETACFLAETFGARVCGIDRSDEMIRQARAKARAKGLQVEFRNADAAGLPFSDAEFDAAICECTLCFLEKERALAEMVRVVRPGGHVGIHDLCWKDGPPADGNEFSRRSRARDRKRSTAGSDCSVVPVWFGSSPSTGPTSCRGG